MDIWSRIYRDHWERDPHPHVIERDDGRVDQFKSAQHYFEVPRFPAEASALTRLYGPVLDIAAGPGSYAIHLQNHGLTVTAIDSSPGAVKIAGMRGCLDARVMDLNAIDVDPDSFASIIMMGNTFGAFQTPDTLPGFMSVIRRFVHSGGSLVTTTIDPLDTDDPSHLLYHERNRDAGRPPGLLTVRIGYRDDVSDWFPLWLTTREEAEQVAGGSGWRLLDEARQGPWRVRTYTAD